MQTKTLRVLDQYRTDSTYADEVGKRYHFRRNVTNKLYNLLNVPDTPFIYYEPEKQGRGEYYGCGILGAVTPDPKEPDAYFVAISNYQEFPKPVPRLDSSGNLRESPQFYNKSNAVRQISLEDFNAICQEGGIHPFSAGQEMHSQFVLSPPQLQMLWARFHERVKGFTDFEDPGQVFPKEETSYKRAVLAKFQQELGREGLSSLVNQGQGKKAIDEIGRLLVGPPANFVSFYRWTEALGGGKNEAATCEILKHYLQATSAPYEGPSSTKRIFDTCAQHSVKPRWDVLGALLWALCPQDFFPVKISYYRKLGEELGCDLPSGLPDAEKLHTLVSFFRAFRTALEPQKPSDWVDVQSFVWCVCPTTYREDTNAPAEHATALPETALSSADLEVGDIPFTASACKSFVAACVAVGFQTDGHVTSRLIQAILAKPFTILTGNSGTGKTKLAELFAYWLSGKRKDRVATVPVGADWTDNRNVLGFVNHLRTTKPHGESDEAPVFQSTKILDLLLAANQQPQKPFFLVLDEMNLSHVERYFADFLSTLESTEAMLVLHRESRKLPRRIGGPADVPETLRLPDNLFVIGTVNVDETTYMFSPKVLDRANVIEFRMKEDAAENFWDAGGGRVKDVEDGSAYAETFLELSRRARGTKAPGLSLDLKSPPSDARDLPRCKDTLHHLFTLMRARHQEFGFRTMAEIIRFLAVDYELTEDKADWDWKRPMDTQILQKILPKLHGSRRKIGPLLAALATYCEEGDMKQAEESLNRETALDSYAAQGEKVFKEPAFPDAHRKLCEMIVTVRRDQFVSFIQ